MKPTSYFPVTMGHGKWNVPRAGDTYILLVYEAGKRLVVEAGNSKKGALLKAANAHEDKCFVMCIYNRDNGEIEAQQLTDELPGRVAGYRQELRKSGARPWKK